MFLLPIKLDRVSFETKGRQNLQKAADFLIESIVFCPLVPPSWISLVDPTSAMYASAIYVSYIYGSALDHGDLTHKSASAVYSCQWYLYFAVLYECELLNLSFQSFQFYDSYSRWTHCQVLSSIKLHIEGFLISN